jgi:hypothetical protein
MPKSGTFAPPAVVAITVRKFLLRLVSNYGTLFGDVQRLRQLV